MANLLEIAKEITETPWPEDSKAKVVKLTTTAKVQQKLGQKITKKRESFEKSISEMQAAFDKLTNYLGTFSGK